MSTIVASASNADGATTTSSVFPFSSESVVTAIITNGGTPPSQMAQVTLELSVDNVTFTEVSRRWAGAVASQAYYNVFEMSDFAGNSSSFAGGSGPQVQQWLYYRLKFTGNVGAAVTIQAYDNDSTNLQVVTLAGIYSTSGGQIGSWVPPQGGPLIITNLVVYATLNSNSSANLSAGIATNATVNSTSLINAVAISGAAGTAIFSGATTGTTVGGLLSGVQAVTFTGSANSPGFAGKAYISYIKP